MKKGRQLTLYFKKLNPTILYLGILLIGIVLMSYQLTKLEQIGYVKKVHADINTAQDSCNFVKVAYKESAACPSLLANSPNSCPVLNANAKNNVANYTWTLTLSSNDKKAHTITYHSGTHFCDSATKTWDSGSGTCTCGDRAVTQDVTLAIPAAGTKTITLQSANPFGKVCGTWQYDFNVTSVDGNANCGFTNGLASAVCETGTTCTGAPPPPPPAAGKSITNLNFGISNTYPWFQSGCGDIRVDNGISDNLPLGFTAIATDATCSTPGLAFTGDTDINTGQGTVSTSGQTVGGSSYPEVYSSSTPLQTSYASLLAKAQNASITPTNLSSVCTLSNCTLPNNLAHGIYLANGDVTLNAANKLKNNSDYIFLINGNLTLNGTVTVPNGSTALFSTSKNIIVAAAVGSPVNCNCSSIAGWFVAGQNFIVNSAGNCNDQRLNVTGAVVINASGNGGTFQNNRDLCAGDLTDPTVTFQQRLDMIFNAPQFLQQQQTISQEIAP